MRDTRYSIGEMSRICNISKKTLRYYDELGLIASRRTDGNNYRYYTYDSLLAVPVLKYYKQMGFTLEEMREFIKGDKSNVYSVLRGSFLSKIRELQKEQEEIRRKYDSVKDWYDLILEAEMVIAHNIHEVSVKYVEAQRLFYMEQDFDNDIKTAIINIEFTDYVEKANNMISGPVMVQFSSVADRVRARPQPVRIMQKVLLPCPEELMMDFGGCMMAACYHIGPHETIQQTYTRMAGWARNNGYDLHGKSCERYVTDYWTTSNSAQYVTEVMIQISRHGVGSVTP